MTATVCTVTTLRAPLHETLMFVNYHLNIGVDHMFLFFDDPNDVSIAALAPYSRVSCVRCDSERWKYIPSHATLSIEKRQILNADFALQLARQDGYSWLIHIDSDELIYLEGSLKRLLAEVPEEAEVLLLRPLEAVLEKYDYQRVFEEVSLFKCLPRGSQLRIYFANLLGCGRVFQGRYFRGHGDGKSIIRVSANIGSVDIHQPTAVRKAKLRTIASSRARLLHFDCRGFESWKTKWLRRYDGTAIAEGMGPDRIRQFEQFVEAYENGGVERLKDLYVQQYFLSNYERIVLRTLGLLRRVQVDARLFQLL